MDSQMKKGIVEVCVLAALLRQESYGYKIIVDLKDCIEISESTLYPILRRLELGGKLTTHSAEINGRLRKYYRITEQGKRQIDDFLSQLKEFNKVADFIENASGGYIK